MKTIIMKTTAVLILIVINIISVFGLLAQTPELNWQYSGPLNTKSYHVLRTEDKNLLIAGLQTGVETINPCVILVDKDGREIWREISFGPVDTILHAIELSNSFIVVGNAANSTYLFKLNKINGDILQTEEITCTVNIVGCFQRYQVGHNGLIKGDGNYFYVAGDYYIINAPSTHFGEVPMNGVVLPVDVLTTFSGERVSDSLPENTSVLESERSA